MGTLGSLIINVSANAKDVRVGFDQVKILSQELAGSIGALGRGDAGGVLQGLTSALPGVGPALGSVVGQMNAWMDSMRQTKAEASRLGTTVGELTQIKAFGGGQSDSMIAGLEHLQRTIGAAASGSTEAQKKLQSFGLSHVDLAGMSSGDQLKAGADAVASMGTNAQQAHAQLELFGKAGQDAFNKIKQGASGVEDAMKRTAPQKDAMEKQEIVFDKMERASKGMKALASGWGAMLVSKLMSSEDIEKEQKRRQDAEKKRLATQAAESRKNQEMALSDFQGGLGMDLVHAGMKPEQIQEMDALKKAMDLAAPLHLSNDEMDKLIDNTRRLVREANNAKEAMKIGEEMKSGADQFSDRFNRLQDLRDAKERGEAGIDEKTFAMAAMQAFDKLPQNPDTGPVAAMLQGSREESANMNKLKRFLLADDDRNDVPGAIKRAKEQAQRDADRAAKILEEIKKNLPGIEIKQVQMPGA